ncbi:hypothetical protein NDU88_011794 [Pleurodeles waltl]|uniref:Uncharacterized protein n=1 Tax=Pleurodeles waltl TaxID=8319 RepID=A0AAV7S6J5_PLEWA|nr:hypothetical protein NDU88_011794 [Pleurodeles waltl]
MILQTLNTSLHSAWKALHTDHWAHTRETRDERGAQAYGAGAGWLASRLAHRECKCEREVRGVRRPAHTVWGLLAAPRVSRRKQPREAGKPRSRVSTVRGAEAAGRGEQLPRAGGCDQGCCLFSPAPSRCGLRRGLDTQ